VSVTAVNHNSFTTTFPDQDNLGEPAPEMIMYLDPHYSDYPFSRTYQVVCNKKWSDILAFVNVLPDIHGQSSTFTVN